MRATEKFATPGSREFTDEVIEWSQPMTEIQLTERLVS